MNVKQVIIIRKDLKMRRGKEVAQGSHASMAFLTHRIQQNWGYKLDETLFSVAEMEWIRTNFRKIVLVCNSQEELLAIESAAKDAKIVSELITDSGLTEFGGVPTMTALALGPDKDEKIDAITGPEGKFPLKLY
jgi:PTH2 family peptidyl-tRNA hydrolase